jgi:hypothetical protein
MMIFRRAKRNPKDFSLQGKEDRESIKKTEETYSL